MSWLNATRTNWSNITSPKPSPVQTAALEFILFSLLLEVTIEKIIMATKLVLHSTKENKNTYKARIAAQYAGVELDFPEGFQMGVQNKTPEFLKLNPNGKVRFYPQFFLGMLITGEPFDRGVLVWYSEGCEVPNTKYQWPWIQLMPANN